MKPVFVVGGLAATAVGATVVATTAISLKKGEEQEIWTPLSEEIKGQESEYGTNSFGGKYGRYLYGVKKHNKYSWYEKFDDYNTDFLGLNQSVNKLKDKFGSVRKGFSDKPTDNDALNNVCNEAYKLDISNSNGSLVDSLSTANTSKYIKDHIWKYCTPGLSTINSADETITADAGVSNPLGADNDSKKELVSTSSLANDWFWKIRETEWDKSQATSGTVFHGSSRPIKDLFADAYKKSSSNENNKKDALKFCSVNPPTPKTNGG